jgi:nucleoid DNA-binding protein
MTKLTKKDLVAELAQMLDLPMTQAEKFLNAYIESITSNLKKGNEVTLTGFGTFKQSKRSARKGRNPQTGAEINIPASTSVKFVVGKTLKDAVK